MFRLSAVRSWLAGGRAERMSAVLVAIVVDMAAVHMAEMKVSCHCRDVDLFFMHEPRICEVGIKLLAQSAMFPFGTLLSMAHRT